MFPGKKSSNIKILKQTELPADWVPWPMSSWRQVQSGGKEGAGPDTLNDHFCSHLQLSSIQLIENILKRKSSLNVYQTQL